MEKMYLYYDTKKGMFVITTMKVPFRISSVIVCYELPPNTTAKEISEFTAAGCKDTKNIKRVEK